MKSWEERIKAIEQAAADLERLAMAKNASGNNKEDVVRTLAAQNAVNQVAKQLSVAIRQEGIGSIPFSARGYRKHPILCKTSIFSIGVLPFCPRLGSFYCIRV